MFNFSFIGNLGEDSTSSNSKTNCYEMEKLKVEEWINGTDVYYWFTHNVFGFPTWLRHYAEPFLYNGFIVTSITWGTLLLEIFLLAAIFMKSKWKKRIFIVGLFFHFGILLIHGLVSFFCNGGRLNAVFIACRKSIVFPKHKKKMYMTFQEKQRLRKPWMLGILLLPVVMLLYLLFKYANTVTIFISLLMALIICVIIFLCIIFIQFTLQVNAQGITLKIIPFNQSLIPWAEIKKIYINKINPLKEFGGWGIRYNLVRGIKGYIFTGRKAIFIEKNNGDKIAFTIINDALFFNSVKDFSMEQLVQNSIT